MKEKVLYENLFTKYRDDYTITKTESYARWSLPTIFADTEIRQGNRIPVTRDFQSVGAMLTNFLASKLTQLLFPANQPFFRLEGTQDMGAMALAMGARESDLTATLADLENASYRRIFMGSSYHQLVHAMKLLIATGNTLLYRDSAEGRTLAYSLRQYTVLRDGTGKVLDIVLKERVSYGTLPPEAQALFRDRKETDELTLWTRCQRRYRSQSDTFEVSQQVEQFDIGEVSEYPAKVCPYIPVVWNLVTGENYGRGLVEDFAGDFAKLSELSQSLTLYEIEATKVLHLVSPGSGTDVDELQGAESGEYVQGKAGEIEAYEAGDYNKIKVIMDDLQAIYQRLAPAFMYSGNVREAERVTAEEIRMNAQEAEVSLGGVYSSLADSLHVPLAHILVNEVNPQFITEVVQGGITLNVLTGVAALGRSSSIQNLLEAANDLALCLPVFAQASNRFDKERIIDMILLGRGVKLSEIMKTEEQLQQDMAQLQNQPLAVQQGIDSPATAEELYKQGIV